MVNFTTTPAWLIPLPLLGHVPLSTFIFGVTFPTRSHLAGQSGKLKCRQHSSGYPFVQCDRLFWRAEQQWEASP
ncbi:MAG: hypothetical protein HC910_06840 [Spirulinaceae cyanobacterium SM2_1_0]|nr:hypothetical protein [Spirulinaceae cyanobacterium SM2_1_0]